LAREALVAAGSLGRRAIVPAYEVAE
jgi:hypothetical protein